MNKACIKYNTRPNVHKLTEQELTTIIMEYDSDWISLNKTRNQLVEKIFELWSGHPILDYANNPIDCLICLDVLTSGNNMTFECGHKFHSSCICKSILVRSGDKYKQELEDKEKDKIQLDFNCPQCNMSIDKYIINKSG